ncbi:hypothetical protein [Pontibacter sp. H249]|uniref:hypothetical protein n=1 Tax=Pontibacter sp. H249 TaxID=3133420 RepID=UPI00404070C4
MTTGGERQYEFLRLYIKDKPKTALDKQSNNTTLELANRIKAKRIEEMLLGTFDLKSKNKGTVGFLKF